MEEIAREVARRLRPGEIAASERYSAVHLVAFATAGGVWDIWFGICWLSWGVLWFLFFLILALGWTRLTQATGALCALQGVYTGWIPGYLLLSGAMPGFPMH